MTKAQRAMIEDEYRDSDGYWINLASGFQWDGAHAVHEPTKAAAYRILTREVKPCTCPDCRPENHTNG